MLLGALAVGGAALAWSGWDAARMGWWRVAVDRPLSATQTEALEECRDPGWIALLRVVAQDFETHCGEPWLVDRLSDEAGGHLHRRWLRRWVGDASGRPRLRLRAALALSAQGELDPALASLAADPRLSHEERAFVADRVAAAESPPVWANPAVRRVVALRTLRDAEFTAAEDLAPWLRREAVAGEAADRAELAHAVLPLLALDGGRLEQLLVRRAERRGFGEVPPDWVAPLHDRGAACDRVDSEGCLWLLADLAVAARRPEAEEGVVHAMSGAPEVPRARLPDPLWTLLYGGDGARLEASGSELSLWADWVRAAPVELRARWLLDAVADPVHTYTVDLARAGRTGDPLVAVRHRTGSPWGSALAALTIAEEAGVEVRVSAWGEGARIEADGLSRTVGPCGAVLELQLDDEGESPAAIEDPWPAESVRAQAMVEAAGAALRFGELGRGGALLALAHRIDPLGTPDPSVVLATVAPAEGEEAAGRAAAQLVRTDDAVPRGAELARRAAAEAHLQVLAGRSSPMGARACPFALGR